MAWQAPARKGSNGESVDGHARHGSREEASVKDGVGPIHEFNEEHFIY